MIESVKEFKERRRNECIVLEQKKFHAQFFNQIEEVAGKEKMAMAKRQEYKKTNRITNYGSTRIGH